MSKEEYDALVRFLSDLQSKMTYSMARDILIESGIIDEDGKLRGYYNNE